MNNMENTNKQKVADILSTTNDYYVEQQEIISRQKDFWVSEFSEEINALELPMDFKRPSIKGYENGSVKFELNTEETEKLKSISAKEGSSIDMALLSVYTILLSKLSNLEDIIVGVPVIVSEHVNTLSLRNHPKGELRFREFLSLLTVRTLTCLNNKSYPFEELIKDLKLEPDISRNPLFDIMFTYQNIDEPEGRPALNFKPHNSGDSIAKFDLTLLVDLTLLITETDGKLLLNFEYSTELFKKETMERFIACFRKIVSTVLDNADVKISDIEIITDKETERILYVFNNTIADYPKTKTIIDLFEEQVKKTPEKVALIYDGGVLTFKELKDWSDKVAIYLREEKGVGVGDLVGVMLERGRDLMLSIFGIIKSGAAYVPINPEYPAERINSIIEDSRLKVLITKDQYINGFPKASYIVNLDREIEKIERTRIKEFFPGISSTDLMYVIYTSGSTGKPKGVMIEHHSVVNRLLWMQKEYPITEHDVILQKTPVVFDVSVWELFWWSITGASLCLLKPGGEKDPLEITDAINKNKVTTMHFVPSMLNAFLSALDTDFDYSKLSSLQYVFASGEALKPEYVNLFNKSIYKNCGAGLINLYGPTEATVDVSYFVCKHDEECKVVPIGKPIDNIQLYVLDKNRQLVPIGVKGELYIAGVGLARGYLHNKELTNEKFVHNPFGGGRIYKTGDFARWLPDGNIEYLGRIDDQVKIRGFRIELGEIESQLSSYGEIKEAIVIVKEKEKNPYLVAYYTSDEDIPAIELRNFLSGKLPEYMVPAFYVQIKTIPLTPNGKLNRKALPDPKIKTDDDYIAPTSIIEKKLVEIWAETLGMHREVIGIHHNFFMIGGNSLIAIKTVQKLKDIIPDISTNDIFVHPTIRELADLFTRKHAHEGKRYNNVSQIEEKLKEKFDIEAQLLTYKLSNNKELIILFLNKTFTADKKSFFKFIEAEIDDQCQPHYIIENKHINTLNDQEKVIAIKEKAFFRFIYKMRLNALG